MVKGDLSGKQYRGLVILHSLGTDSLGRELWYCSDYNGRVHRVTTEELNGIADEYKDIDNLEGYLEEVQRRN